jgi:nicotinate phosphoribosyltransferase
LPLGLLTDLYELTMAAGYVAAGKQHEIATFELFLRRLPPNRNYVLAAGLQQAVEFLLQLRFTAEEIAYLQSLAQFAAAPQAFWDALAGFRFTGDVFAVREGTPVFAGEPLLTVRAPLLEAQIPETFLLATIGFQSLIASKAARVVEAAGGRSVVEFGARRAHSADAGVLAARASYIGGCIGTSNTEAGFRFGIPVFGTSAHSWVMSFDSEKEAFERLQRLLGPAATYLVDTYDTIQGTRTAAALGKPIWGVRLDSGNLAELSRAARRILDDAGLGDAKVMVSGDLNEYKILELVAAGLPIDALGVGTDLVTSADAPSLGAVYKMVELDVGGHKRYTAKFSEEKQNLPGAKQIFRYADRDVVACSWECFGACDGTGATEALLEPVILKGHLARSLDTAVQARQRARAALARLPAPCRSLYDQEHPYRIEYSQQLQRLYQQARLQRVGAEAQ